MSATYYGILTRIGEAKQANALALGTELAISHMSIGDGGGETAPTPTPDPEQTALIGEWRKAPINQLSVDPKNANYLVAEQVLPEDVGGRWIREWGLWDDDGDLIAVSNCPPTYKPLLAEGSGRTQVLRMIIMVASTAAFTLKIDPSVVVSTREYVDTGLLTKANANVQIKAGNGMSGGGTLEESRTLTLATPSTLTAESKNLATAEGHSHQLDVQAHINDDTLGRILTVGAFGLGANNDLDLLDLNAVRVSGLYSQKKNASALLANHYPVDRAGSLSVISVGTNITTQLYIAYVTGEIYSRSRSGETWSSWRCATSNDSFVGLVGYFGRSSAPNGWLKANGAAVSVATFPDLAAAIYCGDANNATAEWGYRCTSSTDPAGTRNIAGEYIVLLDARSEFPRGLDDGRGIDAGRVLGSRQKGSLTAFDPNVAGVAVTGLHPTLANDPEAIRNDLGLDPMVASEYPQIDVAVVAGSATATIAAASGVARPPNVALLACIKY